MCIRLYLPNGENSFGVFLINRLNHPLVLRRSRGWGWVASSPTTTAAAARQQSVGSSHYGMREGKPDGYPAANESTTMSVSSFLSFDIYLLLLLLLLYYYYRILLPLFWNNTYIVSHGRLSYILYIVNLRIFHSLMDKA